MFVHESYRKCLHLHENDNEDLASWPSSKGNFAQTRIIYVGAALNQISLGAGNARIDGKIRPNLDRRPFLARYRDRRYVFSVINEVSLSPNHDRSNQYNAPNLSQISSVPLIFDVLRPNGPLRLLARRRKLFEVTEKLDVAIVAEIGYQHPHCIGSRSGSAISLVN